ncbi:E3 ubiquitin ligase PQT3-like [Citrus sinensis]|uniref:E3 ubiquitin ligase PQT3-like n=1 Tax=Citrus sinensis TaxID=2711 RepID=A0ACB8LUF5_CITSI|nr:E3 ubiquitin ligase PQT3-like [Citrus sinensis]
MAVYYKFKSARDYDSIPMDGPFISVGTLKEKIFESKHLGRGKDFDLLVTNAQTNEVFYRLLVLCFPISEYLDEAMLIPKNTSVLIRRVPGRPRMPIVTEQEPKVDAVVEDTQPEKSGFHSVDSSAMNTLDSEWDEFGNDLYAIPEAPPVQSSNPLLDVAPTNKADEDSKIKALIDTPALDWQRQGPDSFAPGRGFGRGMGGRMGGRGFGLERKTPPQGYVCHRCKVPGHFIQHCPTNGDPKYDVKRFKHPTGIPKSMLIATPDGSYALPSGAAAVLRPNEAAFEKEIEGLPSTRSVSDLPPELHCPLCKEVMKDAVLTSKCCFTSFCDKCIRDQIISKAMCVCGATNILADDLLPNKTLRNTINRILESGNNSSAENAGSTFQVQDMESARCPPPPKVPSPTMSAASKGEQKLSAGDKETPIAMETTDVGKAVITATQSVEKVPPAAKVVDVSEATLESASVKEPASQGSAPMVDEEVQQKMASGEAAKKKKKKKVRAPANDLQWKTPQDLAAESCMMPLGPSAYNPPAAYNPYWTGIQPGMEGYMGPFAGAMPYMPYGMGPLDMAFGGVMPQEPFAAQGYMMPVVPPQRDLAEFGMGMGMNVPPHIMSREEFEARKADVRRKRENERRGERFLSWFGATSWLDSTTMAREHLFAKITFSFLNLLSHGLGLAFQLVHLSHSRRGKPPICVEIVLHSLWEKNKKSVPQVSSADHHHHHRHRPVRSSPEPPLPPPPRPSKRKSEHHHHLDRDRDYDYEYDREREREREREKERERDRNHHHRTESSSKHSSEPPTTTTSSKPTSTAAAGADKKHKGSVFSRISFPEEEAAAAAAKKRKISISSSSEAVVSGVSGHQKLPTNTNGYYDDYKSSSSHSAKALKTAASRGADYESSDDDRHFKRKPSRYEPSPPPPTADWDDEPRLRRKHNR